MKTRRLRTELFVEQHLEDVFEFFADAHNLDRITPPWLEFEILTPKPIAMARGTLIDYRLRIRGVPIRWASEITVWEPPQRFVDEQRRGPYRRWSHEHSFESSNGGTVIIDQVDYAVPGWLLEPVFNGLFVRRDLDAIFKYRHQQIVQQFRKRNMNMGQTENSHA